MQLEHHAPAHRLHTGVESTFIYYLHFLMSFVILCGRILIAFNVLGVWGLEKPCQNKYTHIFVINSVHFQTFIAVYFSCIYKNNNVFSSSNIAALMELMLIDFDLAGKHRKKFPFTLLHYLNKSLRGQKIFFFPKCFILVSCKNKLPFK